jgi:hypothetical protein
LDGNRDRPPGRTAENRSRRDGIRAGAVSGPWRSGPPATEPPVAALPVEAPPAHRRIPRGRPRLAFSIVVGSLLAVALAATAFVLRPAGPEVAATAPPAPAPVAAPAPEAPVAPAQPDPALAGVGSVRLRVPEAMAASRREALVAALAAGGVAEVQVEALPFEVASSRVGYYRAQDLAAAEALARLVGPLVGQRGALPVRDYGKLLDDPEPGRLDLWLGE